MVYPRSQKGGCLLGCVAAGCFSGISCLILSVVVVFVFAGSAAAITGDINGDYIVDLIDVSVISQQWLGTGTADINGSGTVNYTDFALLAQNWGNTDPNLVSWWRFSEGAGAITHDSAPSHNDGTLQDGAFWARDVWGIGFSDYDESADPACRIDVPTNGMKVEAGTLSLWARLDGPQNTEQRFMFGISGSAVGTRMNFFQSDWTTWLGIGVGTVFRKQERISHLEVGKWYHMVMTWVETNAPESLDGTFIVYLNGQQVSTGSHTMGTTEFDAIAHIGGAGTDLNRGFCGTISEVRIFNRVLSAAEVAELYEIKPISIIACNPSPSLPAATVSSNADLSWTAGVGATSHDVYFGTNFFNVADGLAGAFKGNITSTSYDPGTLAANTAYYWRIDEHNPSGVVTGDVWVFTTGASFASISLNIACTEQALRNALYIIDAMGAGGTITFDCPASAIGVTSTIYFYGDNLTIDGQNKITFNYAGIDRSHDICDSHRFIELYGNNNQIKNCTVTSFPIGIQVAQGLNNVLDNIAFPAVDRAAIIHNADSLQAFGTDITDCIFDNNGRGCGIIISDVSNKSASKGFHNDGGSCTIEYCTFNRANQPMVANAVNNGLYTVSNCVFNLTGSIGAQFGNPVAGTGHTLILENSTINIPSDGCDGFTIFGSCKAIMRHNVFDGGRAAAVYADDTAFIRLEYNEIKNSGGSGVLVTGNSKADLGGGSLLINGSSASSLGHNWLHANGNYDLKNNTGTQIKAENNGWDHTTVADVLAYDVSGSADVDPLGSNDFTPPSPDPLTWASYPAASSLSISMTATTATDASGPVQYYFECTNDATKSRTWNTSASYTASSLAPNTPYYFRCKAKDNVGNESLNWSTTESATTGSGGNTPSVSVQATTANAYEGGAAGQFTVSRGISGTSDLVVNYTVSGTAASVSDYTALSGSVTIALGAVTANIAVAAVDDSVYEGDETVIVTIAAGTGYDIGSPSSATVTIKDNDPLPIISTGFESGKPSGWTNDGTVNYVTTDKYSGTKSAQIQNANSLRTNSGTASTLGYNTIHVKYARKVAAYTSGQSAYLEWTADVSVGTPVWVVLETVPSTATTWTYVDLVCPAGANNNSKFGIRFRGGATSNSQYFYIDDVEVAGFPQ